MRAESASRVTSAAGVVVAAIVLVSACGSSTRATTGSPTAVQLGAGLVQAKPCLVCHTTTGAPAAGPTFAGLAGSTVKLSDGTTVTADDAYLKRSILDPSAQTVAGFPKGLMAKIVKPYSISPRQADQIVAFLHTLARSGNH